MHLSRYDSHRIDLHPDVISCFAGIRDEFARLPDFLRHYRALGVKSFFFMDNGSTDGTREYLMEQEDCHCFNVEGSHFANNVAPPNWTHSLLNVYGHNRWCVVVDIDELLVYPHVETVSLDRLCVHLQSEGSDALVAHMIDMYSSGRLLDARFSPELGQLKSAPYFDAAPGRRQRNYNSQPSVQMFGGVRERIFWHGRFKKMVPPCLTKIPLIRWWRGRRYLVAQHLVDSARTSRIEGGLLHFKFLDGFKQKNELSLVENSKVQEKGLEERIAYSEILRQRPDLSLHYQGSVAYRDTMQLVQLGWLRTDGSYEAAVGRIEAQQNAPTA